jgi:hypothetical protein
VNWPTFATPPSEPVFATAVHRFLFRLRQIPSSRLQNSQFLNELNLSKGVDYKVKTSAKSPIARARSFRILSIFPVSREFAPQTGSPLTASSASY